MSLIALNEFKNFIHMTENYDDVLLQGIVDGEYDHMPEQAFYMVGSIEEAVEKAESMKAEA